MRGFQRRIELGETHRHRVGVEGLEGLQIDRIGDHPDLDAVEVFALGDRPAAVGDVAEAEVPIAETDQTLLRKLGQQRRAERTVEQRVGLLRRQTMNGKSISP